MASDRILKIRRLAPSLLIFFIVFILIPKSFSQEWEYISDRPEREMSRGVISMHNHVFILGSNWVNIPNGGAHLESIFIKLDNNGNEVEYNRYWGDHYPHRYRIKHVVTSGDTILGLVQYTPPSSWRKTALIQLNINGEMLSEQQIEVDSFYTIITEGFYKLTGDTVLLDIRTTTDPNQPIDFSNYLVLTDKNLSFVHIHKKEYTPYQNYSYITFGAHLSNKNTLNVFTNLINNSDDHFTLVEDFDLQMNLKRRNLIQREDFRRFYDIIPHGDNYIAAGEIDPTGGNGSFKHSYVAEMDSIGNIISEGIYQCFTPACNWSTARSIVQDEEGYIYTLSDYWDNLNMDVYSEYNARIQKLDPEFNVVWDYILRPPEIQVKEMIMSEDGYLLVTGTQTSETFFSSKLNAYVAKIDLDGTLVDISGPLQHQSILSIYPNPSSGIISIHTSFTGSLKIFNNQGQEIQSEFIQKGNNIQVNIDDPGIYFLQLIDEKGNMIDVKKAVVIK